MKKIKTCFTQEEIDLLKQHLNLAEIARKFGVDTESRYIYRIMRNFPKTKGSKAFLIQTYLEEKLAELKAA